MTINGHQWACDGNWITMQRPLQGWECPKESLGRGSCSRTWVSSVAQLPYVGIFIGRKFVCFLFFTLRQMCLVLLWLLVYIFQIIVFIQKLVSLVSFLFTHVLWGTVRSWTWHVSKRMLVIVRTCWSDVFWGTLDCQLVTKTCRCTMSENNYWRVAVELVCYSEAHGIQK